MKKIIAALCICLALTLLERDIQAKPEPAEKTATKSSIDSLVFARLEFLGLKPAGLCSDSVFLRRVFLDLIGTLPTEAEARQFLRDSSPSKRASLVERLLQRDEFADFWALKWADLLRVKSEFPINLWPNAVQAYHRWIRKSIKDNKPYDQFVRELLTSSGSNFRVPPVNFYRAVQSKTPQGLAQAVALTFMGEREEKWLKSRREGMAKFFSQVRYKRTAEWKEEIVTWIPPAPMAGPISAVYPDGRRVSLPARRDPRTLFADWLITPKNPWFTRNIANRIWFWLLGRGVIHEPDDLQGNSPSNPALLTLLEKALISARYDLKQLFRQILNSQTYQQSSIPKSQDPRAAHNFAHYPLRRLGAEVLIDALCQISGTGESYSSAIPEPFTFLPGRNRSIALADGSISSSFLDLFGRPSRDTGLESERSNEVTVGQRLHLLNSSHIQQKIKLSLRAMGLQRMRRSPRRLLDTVYLTILSRFPTEQERQTIETQRKSTKSRQLIEDTVRALLNSDEFLFRH